LINQLIVIVPVACPVKGEMNDLSIVHYMSEVMYGH